MRKVGSLKTIPEKFQGRGQGDQSGYEFEIVTRSPVAAIYAKTGHGSTTYEVMKIRTHRKPRIMQGQVLCEAGDEYLPSTKLWGSYGWSVQTLERAREKFDQLNSAP